MITLYRHELSGHSHRIELFLNLLKLPFERVDVDLQAGAHKQPEFLALNPFGQVPVLTDGELVLSDSNAILVYLAERYASDSAWIASEPSVRATQQRWLSVAAGELAAGPASARLVTVFGASLDHQRTIDLATHLFGRLEAHLADSSFLVGDQPSIADVALYSYTAHAPEGNVSLAPYPRIRAWLARIESLPGFVPMTRTPVGLAA